MNSPLVCEAQERPVYFYFAPVVVGVGISAFVNPHLGIKGWFLTGSVAVGLLLCFRALERARLAQRVTLDFDRGTALFENFKFGSPGSRHFEATYECPFADIQGVRVGSGKNGPWINLTTPHGRTWISTPMSNFEALAAGLVEISRKNPPLPRDRAFAGAQLVVVVIVIALSWFYFRFLTDPGFRANARNFFHIQN